MSCLHPDTTYVTTAKETVTVSFREQIVAILPEIDFIQDETLRERVFDFYKTYLERQGFTPSRLLEVPYTMLAGPDVPSYAVKTQILVDFARDMDASDESLAALLMMDIFKVGEIQEDVGTGSWKQINHPDGPHAKRAEMLARELGFSASICDMILNHGAEPEIKVIRMAKLQSKDPVTEHQGKLERQIFEIDFLIHDLFLTYNLSKHREYQPGDPIEWSGDKRIEQRTLRVIYETARSLRLEP